MAFRHRVNPRARFDDAVRGRPVDAAWHARFLGAVARHPVFRSLWLGCARILGRTVDAAGCARLASHRHDQLAGVRRHRDLLRRLAVPRRRALRRSTHRPHRSPPADAYLPGARLLPGHGACRRRHERVRPTLASADCRVLERVAVGASDSDPAVARAVAGPARGPDQRHRLDERGPEHDPRRRSVGGRDRDRHDRRRSDVPCSGDSGRGVFHPGIGDHPAAPRGCEPRAGGASSTEFDSSPLARICGHCFSWPRSRRSSSSPTSDS